MEKSCTLKEILRASTSNSSQEDSYELMCEYQDNDLSSEINAFLSTHQVQYANQSKIHPNLPHLQSIVFSIPALRQLQLLQGTESLDLIKIKNTWNVYDYFLKIFHIVKSLHFWLFYYDFFLIFTRLFIRVGILLTLFLMILWRRHENRSKSL